MRGEAKEALLDIFLIDALILISVGIEVNAHNVSIFVGRVNCLVLCLVSFGPASKVVHLITCGSSCVNDGVQAWVHIDTWVALGHDNDTLHSAFWVQKYEYLVVPVSSALASCRRRLALDHYSYVCSLGIVSETHASILNISTECVGSVKCPVEADPSIALHSGDGWCVFSTGEIFCIIIL